MNIPPDFDRKVGPNKVCKLKEPPYKLKQSPRARFDRFVRVTDLGCK